MRAGLRSYWWLAALCAVLAYTLLDPASGIRPWWALRGELARAEERRSELRDGVALLEAKIAELRRSPFETERAVREVLGFAQPGEVVVRLPRPGLPNSDLTAPE